MSNNENSPAGKDDQEVGYGKPPKEHQFKKGNKLGKGRPKGAANMKTLVNAALSVKVSTKIGGKTKKMTKAELALHQLAHKASQGDLKAIDKVIAMHERYGPQEDPEGPSEEKLNYDLSTLKDYLAMKQLIDPDDEEDEND